MYLTYEKYRSLGYDCVPEGEFARYCSEACAVIDFFTSGRISATEDIKILRGICEIVDVIKKRRDEDNGSLTGFSNEGYSENYKYTGTAELYAEIYAVMTVWFDPDLLSRGICREKIKRKG